MQIVKIYIFIFFVFAPMLFFKCTDAHGEEQTSKMSVCDIYKNGASLDNSTVQLRARVQSDGMEYSYLMDPNCDQFGIGLLASPTDKVQWHEINQIMFGQGLIGTGDKIIEADFTGKLHFQKNKRWKISISSIKNLSWRFIP